MLNKATYSMSGMSTVDRSFDKNNTEDGKKLKVETLETRYTGILENRIELPQGSWISW